MKSVYAILANLIFEDEKLNIYKQDHAETLHLYFMNMPHHKELNVFLEIKDGVMTVLESYDFDNSIDENTSLFHIANVRIKNKSHKTIVDQLN